MKPNLNKEEWRGLVSALSNLGKNGIGLQCPFCGERSVNSIGSGILEVGCGTRIAIEPYEKTKLNVVTRNGHVLHGNAAYPYTLFDCSLKTVDKKTN